MSHKLATSSENLVASAQFLEALVTSKLQFQALSGEKTNKKVVMKCEKIMYTVIKRKLPVHSRMVI